MRPLATLLALLVAVPPSRAHEGALGQLHAVEEGADMDGNTRPPGDPAPGPAGERQPAAYYQRELRRRGRRTQPAAPATGAFAADEKKAEGGNPTDFKAVYSMAAGMAVGALIGFMVGGPIGAVVGLLVGALIGGLAAKMSGGGGFFGRLFGGK